MRVFIVILVLLIILFGCTTDKTEVFSTKGKITTTALVVWQGDYASDGCGFFVIINQKEYKPKNETVIGDEFKSSEPVEVEVTFRFLAEKVEYYCGFAGIREMDGIEIISIRKK